MTDAIYVGGASDSDAVVLDYFAGSGTTGHAVIALNRKYGGTRKYVLVEMGDYFDTVLLPRLKKAVYAPDWDNGVPQSRDKQCSHMLKYVRLESYEDALANIVNPRHTDFQSVEHIPQVRHTLTLMKPPAVSGAHGGALPAQNPTSQDSDLALLIECWPDLPEHIRAAVTTLVRSTLS